ncbi:MAG: alkaline phosphatase family protein [Acidimicrobiia bacterium]
MEPISPDYLGASVAGLVPALLGRRPSGWLPSCLEGVEAVVLLVLDGVGWRALEEHRPENLHGLEGNAITTVVPSTTAAALTSIATGTPPARHGIVGYRMRVGGQVLDVLRWRVPEGRAPAPDTVASVPAFLGRPIPVVTRGEFARTGFTEVHMNGARFVGWRTMATLVEHVRRLVGDGERLVYAYYDGVDKVAHEYGLESGFFAAELASTDRLVGDLLEALPPQAALVVTSDHGQVQFREWMELTDISKMVAAYAGDARFRYLHARPGAAQALAEAAEELCGNRAWVFPRDRLVDEGWLGPEPPAGPVLSRIGDVTLAARGSVAFVDPTHPQETRLVAGHGSLTPEEMLVPLLAGRGRG